MLNEKNDAKTVLQPSLRRLKEFRASQFESDFTESASFRPCKAGEPWEC